MVNIKNNRRRKESQNRIEKVFIKLLQNKEVKQISVTEICKLAHVNRSTFYANYLDIYDLVNKIGDKMISDFHNLYFQEENQKYNSNDFLKLFQHIKDNQIFYKTYFKLGFDQKLKINRYDQKLAEKYFPKEHIPYHIEFFRAGITTIIKKWLANDCDLSPKELNDIIIEEYQNRHK